MAADRQHLHHRLLNIGHSYRQSVLIMYLWAALFSVTVVSLSIVRSPSVVFFAATLVAVLALLPATMPRLRPWRSVRHKATPAVAARAANVPAASLPGPNVPAANLPGPNLPAANLPGPNLSAPNVPVSPPSGAAVNGAVPFRDPDPFPGDARPASPSAVPADPLPRAGRLPGADPFPGPGAFASQEPFPAAAGEPGEEPADGRDPFPRAQRPGPRPR
jgi:hypothetical protein